MSTDCTSGCSYVGHGNAYITGCTKYKLYLYNIYKYKPGNILYLESKAKIGKLEKIVIKKVRLVGNKQTSGQVRFIYQDTLNALYNEWELINEYDALLLAKNYYERQMFFAIAAQKPC